MWLSVMILASAGTDSFLVRKAWWESDDIPVVQEAIARGRGFEGTDEYDPAKDDHSNLPARARQVQVLAADGAEASVRKAEIRIARWTAEEKELSVTSPEPLRLAMRVLNYPGWRVEIDGKAVTPQLAETTAQMILPLSAGTHRITMRFGRTTDRTSGGLISVGAGVVFLVLLFLGQSTRHSQN